MDQLVNSQSDIENLKKMGFVNAGGAGVLSHEEIKQLKELSSNLMIKFEKLSRQSDEHTDYINSALGIGARALTRFCQHDPLVSELINKIVSNERIKAILNSVFGEDYKIWGMALRTSYPGDKGLNLHQDSSGETNMAILLDDNLSGDGATTFLPSSHMISKRARVLGVEAPPVLVNLMRGFLKPLTGRAGDIGFFFNRTWHGRFSNRSSMSHDVILISFFPSGATFGFGGSYPEWSQTYLNEIKGTELGRLIDPSIGTELIGEKRYKVANLCGTAKMPFALQIENPQDHSLKPSVWRLYSVKFLLRPVMLVGRRIKRILSTLKSIPS
jgi:putative 2OG-Fe(II) oxygenase